MPAQRRMTLTKINARYVLTYTGSQQLQVEFEVPGEDGPEHDEAVLKAVRRNLNKLLKLLITVETDG